MLQLLVVVAAALFTVSGLATTDANAVCSTGVYQSFLFLSDLPPGLSLCSSYFSQKPKTVTVTAGGPVASTLSTTTTGANAAASAASRKSQVASGEAMLSTLCSCIAPGPTITVTVTKSSTSSSSSTPPPPASVPTPSCTNVAEGVTTYGLTYTGQYPLNYTEPPSSPPGCALLYVAVLNHVSNSTIGSGTPNNANICSAISQCAEFAHNTPPSPYLAFNVYYTAAASLPFGPVPNSAGMWICTAFYGRTDPVPGGLGVAGAYLGVSNVPATRGPSSDASSGGVMLSYGFVGDRRS